VLAEFATPWRNYGLDEMDRFDLDGEVVYVTHDRTGVFIERLTQAPPVHLANQDEIDSLWEKYRLVALLRVASRTFPSADLGICRALGTISRGLSSH
jgi:hypothetical protein